MARLAASATTRRQRGRVCQDHPEGGVMSRLGNITGRLYRGEVSYDFVGRQKRWYTISGVILLIAIAAWGIRGLNYSVDFKGGSVYEFSAPRATQTQVANTVSSAGAGNTITVQRVNSSPPKWQVETPTLGKGTEFKVQDEIHSRFGIPKNSISIQAVSSTWGAQISEKALEALIAFLIVIVLYLSIAFDWRMASAALVALVHDIVITVGVYALTGFQVSPATVIGLLTILGYSLYDTVVVFDKVRENTTNILVTRRVRYSDAANLALNQTLVRSINTSLIALLPVVSILAVSVFLLGNGELKDLSLVLFVGMLSGTYSSIFIATPVLCDLKERQPEYRQLTKQIAQRAVSAAKKQAKVAVGSKAGGSTAVTGDADGDADGAEMPQDEPETEFTDDAGPASAAPVAAGRPGGSSAGARPAAGPRQQPRRSSSAQRRPSGKKKRR
jgi:preprotein translocase subunit SecF